MTHVLPFRQFVLKVHSRCDLACDHCYVYEHADQSWRSRPKMISEQTVSHVARRIAEHAAEHQLPAVHVVLHGGEPLLLGVQRTRAALQTLRAQIEPVTSLDLRIHTNGVLLDNEFCALFREFDVKVGVSLDGDRAANDRHRRFANGRSSHGPVLRALELLRQPEFAHLYAGILCTIDVANDPIAVYEALAEQRPRRVDLLLPHATWDSPPARTDASRAEYADWLTAIYDRWTADGRPFGIRTFDSILAALHGEPSQTESLGLTPTDLLVIETDGTMEQADSLKTAFDGAAATGLDVVRHSFDDAARHEGIEARQQGLDGLCGTCRQCPVVNVCGGGLYAHRFRTGSGFANPSVYCEDLKATIVHIQAHRPAAETGAVHTVTADEFDTLASGHGSAEAVVRLAEAQVSIRRTLIATVISASRSTAALADAGNLLVRLDLENPEALDTVLADPSVRSWATGCVDAFGRGVANPIALAYLSNVALAAATRAGVDAKLVVPVVAGTVQLPTLGHVEVGGRGDALVTVEGAKVHVARDDHALGFDLGAQPPDPAWHPVQRVTVAPGLPVSLNTDDEADAKLVRDALPEAADLLARLMPDYYAGLRAAFGTITTRVTEPCDTLSAVAVAPTNDPTELAISLLRGFQRTKLHALLDLFDLVDPAHATAARQAAENLLYLAYEGLAVNEWRRARRQSLGENPAGPIEQLSDHPALTDLGRRFVAGMARTAKSWAESATAPAPRAEQ